MRGKTRAEIRLFRRDEMERILTHMPSRSLLPARLGANLGLSGPELFSLEWLWVDFNKNEMFVKWSPHVTGRFVLLPRAITRCLETHKSLAPSSLKVLSNPDGGPLRAHTFHRDFKSACKEAGIENGSFGDIRLSNARWLLEAGAQPSLVAARLGMNRHTIRRHFGANTDEQEKEYLPIYKLIDQLVVLGQPTSQ